ncbi:hypothetical protein BH11MYX2_BH11MYX2_28270 [soil metagenome]
MTRILGIVLGLVACSHDESAGLAPGSGSAARTENASTTRGDAAAADAAVLDAAAHAGDVAYVADATGLVEVGPSGAKVIAKDVTWCNADARAQVVWFVSDGGLQAYDLVDHAVHPVIAHDLDAHGNEGAIIGSLEPIIDWGNQKLGGEDAVSFDVGVAVHMNTAPRLELVMGCEGDRGVYCFDEHHKPSASVVALRKLAKQLSVDQLYVAVLAERGKSRSLWTPPPMPPTPPSPPALDREKCTEDKERCGQLTAIPGSPLWLVVTANSRGDYYHESRELWDPGARAFVRITGDKLVRAKDPQGENGPELDFLRSSPAGLLSLRGIVFDATHVLYAPQETGRTCVFASGGWRVGGPRG